MGPEKLLILGLIVALVFGAGAVPRLGRRAGKGIRETKDALGIDEIRTEIGEFRATLTGPAAKDATLEASTPAEPVDPVNAALPEPARDSQS